MKRAFYYVIKLSKYIGRKNIAAEAITPVDEFSGLPLSLVVRQAV